MKRISNKKFALNILVISVISILIIYCFVEAKLSKMDMELFMIMFNFILLTAFMVLILMIFIIIFFVRLASKKENCYGRTLSIIAAITFVTISSTAIMVIEESRYYHTINSNWNIHLPREYEEIYYKDSRPSFHGDGKRYSVFEYETLDEINNVLKWRDKKNDIELLVKDALVRLEVPIKYYPNFNYNFKYYYDMQDDRSEIYIILDSSLRRAYIIEKFL